MKDANKEPKIKVDFNLLMSGTWVLEKKGKKKIYKFEKEIGNGKITIYNALDVPAVLDSKFLDYLMLKSQENGWSQKVVLDSLRAIAKDIGIGTDKRKLDRIKRSLEILVNTRIKFENCFIDNGTLEYIECGDYEIVNIGILNDYTIEKVQSRGKPRKITVWFNKNFLALCKHSLGYKLIPYTPIGGLKDTAYALYKWAWRWFDNSKGFGERWIGDGKGLVSWYKNELNSMAKYKYPSEVIRRIKIAIKQLNQNSKVAFFFQLKQENGSYKIEIYPKKNCIIRKSIPFDRLSEPVKTAVISLLQEKKHIKNPYAVARSMSDKEIQKLLDDLVMIRLSQGAWNVLQIFQDRLINEVEKSDLKPLAFIPDKDEKFVQIITSKLKLKRTLEKYLDNFDDGWRKTISSITVTSFLYQNQSRGP